MNAPTLRSKCTTCKHTHGKHLMMNGVCGIDGCPCRRFVAKVKPRSRPDRWADAAGDARTALDPLREALEALNEVRREYEEWRDNLPENLQSSALGDKLNTIADIDLDSAISSIDDIDSTLSEAEGADMPRGFGKD